MTIKELAYAAQQHLEAATGKAFKRSHFHELLAASFGFKSYSAAGVDTVFIEGYFSRRATPPQAGPVARRCLALGYPPEDAASSAAALLDFLSGRQIGAMSFAELIDTLPDWGLADALADEANLSNVLGSWPQLVGAMALESLNAAACRGDPRAHYALALIFEVDDDGPEYVKGGGYWLSQMQAGRILVGVEKEWAEEQAAYLERRAKFRFHLHEAARLGHAQALNEPETMWEVGDDDDDEAELEEYAMHEDGSEYDDDVGGPMYVGVRTPIT